MGAQRPEGEHDSYAGFSSGKPRLNCSLRLWHRWRTHQIEGGERFQTCRDCGKYREVTRPGLAGGA